MVTELSTTSRTGRSAAGEASQRPGKRFGSTLPRVFTPPLRDVDNDPDATLGFDVIEFARELMDVDLYPWQQWLLKHLLELLPDGRLRFRTAIVLVARQNGKSTVAQVLALYMMAVYGWRRVLGTAQQLDVAEDLWQTCVDLVEDEDSPLHDLLSTVVRTNGKKSLDLITGAKYRVKAANRRAGRGFWGNLVLLDELREHQSWAAWGAITKTTMAQREALVLGLSNAGDVASIVLRYLRKQAHRLLGDPDKLTQEDVGLVQAGISTDPDLVELQQDGTTLFIAEWSAPPGTGIWDRDGWAQANPALGYGGFQEANVAAAAATDDEGVFRTEVLCQWSDGLLEGPFPPGSWESGKWHPDPPGSRPPAPRLPVKAGIDVDKDRTRAVVTVAGIRDDGVVQVEVAAARAGVDWVLDWFRERVDLGVIDEITGQTNGAPVSGLLLELKTAGLPVVDLAGKDLLDATGRIFDAVRDGLFVHLPQPILDLAAAVAVVKRTESGGILFDRVKSPHDIAALIATLAAYWLLVRPVEEIVSEYEDHDLLVV